MDSIGRILLIFIIAASVILLLSIMGMLPPGTSFKLVSASMLLAWLAVLARGILLRSADEGRVAIFQESCKRPCEGMRNSLGAS